jgi:multicomponent Na+:H+ antiporter subunit A
VPTDPLPWLLLLALLGPVAVAGVAAATPRLAAAAAIGVAGLTFALSAVCLGATTGEYAIPWAMSWGLRATVGFDGLAALYCLLASGIGLVVFVYAGAYMPLHLRHDRRPPAAASQFWIAMTGFLGAMIWLACARDLLLLFVAWDATAIASYFLIGFDRQRPEARRAALMALLVTGVTAVGFLLGAGVLLARYGTLDVGALAGLIEPGPETTAALALIAVAALAKSAQAPLHFWLPRAMAAPTPVSSYLHSAAMVAAGVYLLARVAPLFAAAPAVREGMVVVGFLSMATGGVLALASDEFKRVLAYSTIAQYGYVVVLLGLGGAYGFAGSAVFVAAHAIAKCGLFLTAGAVTEATGEKALSRAGGLWRRFPVLAAASGVCAAALAALPLTVGFFKDEVFFAATARGGALPVLAVAGAALSFAYAARYWTGIFLGAPGSARLRPIPPAMTLPVVVLAVASLLGGVILAPLERLAESAGMASALEPAPISLAYHLDARPENVMAVAAWAFGALILVAVRRAPRALPVLAERLGRFGPEWFYDGGLRAVNALSDNLYRIEVHDLRSRVVTLLAPSGVLVLAAVLTTPFDNAFVVGTVGGDDVPLLLMLLVLAQAAIAAAVPRDHLAVALMLAGVGYSLTVVYALLGAPDVALVAVLVETLFALFMIGMLAALPRSLLTRAARYVSDRRRKRRDILLAGAIGCAAFAASWGVLSQPAALESVAQRQIELAPDAHARDVVTAILADFRGLDTMGEISVVGVALLGLTALLARERRTR